MFQCSKMIMRNIALSFAITLPFLKHSFSTINTIQSHSIIKTAGIYLHIPFCRRRCFYCDFPIKVIGDREGSRESAGSSYTKTLLRDISAWTSLYYQQEQHMNRDYIIDSIYFGGGTPSLLPDSCVKEILDTIRKTFILSPSVEITFEMDPGTFDYERLQRMKEYGINRISIGVQSFNSDMLKNCGRVHTLKDVIQSIDDLHKANWDNFSIDLISSLPHMTMDIWIDTLNQAIACNSKHISIYDLQVEENTAFGRWYTPGIFPLPNEELSSNMYKTAVEMMTKPAALVGHQQPSPLFEHYEVSNYARTPQYRSKHNQKYWKLMPVLGFGMSAASLYKDERFQRPSTMNDYNNYVENLEKRTLTSSNINTLIDNHIDNNHDHSLKNENIHTNNTDSTSYDNTIDPEIALTPSDNSVFPIPDILEVIMLSLRTSDGLDIPYFIQLYGIEAMEKLLKALYPYHCRQLVIFYNSKCNIINDKDILLYIHNTNETDKSGKNSDNNSDNNSDSKIKSNIIKDDMVDIKRIRLTDPEGFMISNEIISTLFAKFS